MWEVFFVVRKRFLMIVFFEDLIFFVGIEVFGFCGCLLGWLRGKFLFVFVDVCGWWIWVFDGWLGRVVYEGSCFFFEFDKVFFVEIEDVF